MKKKYTADPGTDYPDFITAATVAKYLGVTVATLANWRCRKQGPPFYKFGGSVRYEMEEVKTFCRNNRTDGGPDDKEENENDD